MRGLGLGLIPRPRLDLCHLQYGKVRRENLGMRSLKAVLFRTRLALYQSGLGMRLERDTMVNIVQ